MLSNDELSDLIAAYLPIFYAAARYVCAVRANELRDEIAYAWWIAYNKKPVQSLRVFNQPDTGVFIWAKWRAREIVRKWLRHEEESLDTILDSVGDVVVMDAEYGLAPHSEVGNRDIPTCDYLIDHDDMQRLFASAARRSDNLIDALDLLEAFQNASPAKRLAIRKLLSGYAKSEIGSYGYEAARAQLQTAV